MRPEFTLEHLKLNITTSVGVAFYDGGGKRSRPTFSLKKRTWRSTRRRAPDATTTNWPRKAAGIHLKNAPGRMSGDTL